MTMQNQDTRNFRKAALRSTMISTALASLLSGLASPAFAQAKDDKASDDQGVGEIIVTAQKRTENAQSVPIAITAIDNSRLSNTAVSVSTTNLQMFVPGLVMGRAGTAGATFLRGVGTETGVAGTESPVATYVDGIYMGVNALGVFELNNVAQIAVLKGPQGTLFGRNATGGAIQVTTKNPSLDAPQVVGELGYGNYDTFSGRFYGSAPLGSTLAASAAVLYKDRGKGTVLNIGTGNRVQADKVFSAQGKILWQPDTDTSFLVNYIHNQGKDLPGLNYFVQKGALSQDGETTYVGPRTVNLFIDANMRMNSNIVALTASHDFGWAKLTNTTSRTWFTNNAFNDQSMTHRRGNPAGITPAASELDADIKEFSNELQLQSSGDSAFQWITGLFYFNDKTTTHLQVYNYPAGSPVAGFGLTSHMGTDSYAAYAQGTAAIADNTKLTLGVRYTHDDKSFDGTNVFGGTRAATVPASIGFDKVTWRASIDHKLSPDVMIYASANRGFRAGTYSALSLTNPPARPETLDAYEVGFKGDLLDKKLRLNAAGFYYNYSDLQLRQNVSLGVGTGTTALILNAAKARVYGLDVDFEARPVSNFRIFGGFEILDGKYTSFPGGPANFPVGVSQLGLPAITAVPAGCSGAIRSGVLLGGHSNTVFCNLSGNDMINAPRFSASLGAELAVPTSMGKFTFNVSDKYTGKSYATPDNVQVLESYHYLSASLTWDSNDEHFFAKVYATNITEPDRPAQLASSLNTFEFLPNEPRFYGASVGFRF